MAVPLVRASDPFRKIRNDAIHAKRSDPRDVRWLIDRINEDAQPFAMQRADEFAGQAVDSQSDVGDLGVSRKSRRVHGQDRKSTRLNSSHGYISYAVFCLKKKKKIQSLNRVMCTDRQDR